MKRTLLLPLFLLLFVYSCQKDPSTLPARVQFSFGMAPFESGTDLKELSGIDFLKSPNFLIIDDGRLVISKIDFEGRRQNVGDVFFTASFDPPIIIDLKEEIASRVVQFDIPQGIYERIEMVFFLGAPGQLPLLMTGQANLPASGQKQVRFEYQFSEPVRVKARDKTENEIVLRKDEISNATLIINAAHLFRLVNPGLINSAQIINENDTEVILISQGANPSIFNVVANRLSQSFEVTFE